MVNTRPRVVNCLNLCESQGIVVEPHIIQFAVKGLASITIVVVPTECNKIADWIAGIGLVGSTLNTIKEALNFTSFCTTGPSDVMPTTSRRCRTKMPISPIIKESQVVSIPIPSTDIPNVQKSRRIKQKDGI